MVLMGLLVALSGCIVIPIPEHGRKVTADWKARSSKLLTDHATREEVTRQLGSPAWDFPDLQVIGYRWSGVEWSAIWIAGGAGGAGGGFYEPTSHRLLWLNFDGQDRLAHSKLITFPEIETRTKWERARCWRETLGPPPPVPPKRFESSSPPPGKALVHIFWHKGNVGSFVEAVKIDGLCSANLRKGAFTTLVLEPGHHDIEVLSKPLPLDLASDEVCFLSFHPSKKTLSQGTALARCPESDAVKRLKTLTFCK